MAGISCDGDGRLLRGMKIKIRIGRIHPQNMPSFYNSELTEIAYVQDPTHIGTKIRNELLQPSVLLPMGNILVSISHLKILFNEHPKDHHGLVLSDKYMPGRSAKLRVSQKGDEPKNNSVS